MNPEITKLLNAFEREHANAWIADQREWTSDAHLDHAWAKSHKARQALVIAIEELEAKLEQARALERERVA